MTVQPGTPTPYRLGSTPAAIRRGRRCRFSLKSGEEYSVSHKIICLNKLVIETASRITRACVPIEPRASHKFGAIYHVSHQTPAEFLAPGVRIDDEVFEIINRRDSPGSFMEHADAETNDYMIEDCEATKDRGFRIEYALPCSCRHYSGRRSDKMRCSLPTAVATRCLIRGDRISDDRGLSRHWHLSWNFLLTDLAAQATPVVFCRISMFKIKWTSSAFASTHPRATLVAPIGHLRRLRPQCATHHLATNSRARAARHCGAAHQPKDGANSEKKDRASTPHNCQHRPPIHAA